MPAVANILPRGFLLFSKQLFDYWTASIITPDMNMINYLVLDTNKAKCLSCISFTLLKPFKIRYTFSISNNVHIGNRLYLLLLNIIVVVPILLSKVQR